MSIQLFKYSITQFAVHVLKPSTYLDYCFNSRELDSDLRTWRCVKCKCDWTISTEQWFHNSCFLSTRPHWVYVVYVHDLPVMIQVYSYIIIQSATIGLF